MFSKFEEIYKATFESNDNGQRIGNPAINQDAILSQHPEWQRNEWAGYFCYASDRIYSGHAHQQAMETVNKTMEWR